MDVDSLTFQEQTAALVGAVAWSVVSPGEFTVNDQPNLLLAVLTTVLIQIPLCAVLLYGALHLFFYSTLRPIRKTYNKMP